jgi:hypothetical protein
MAASFPGLQAEAEGQWREYAYADEQFAVSFPAAPSVVTIPSPAPNGARVTEKVYFLEQENSRFQISVFDLLNARMNETTVIARAAAALRDKGEVKLDIVAEVQGHWGHFMSVQTREGSHIVAGVFFRNDRLYEIEASAPEAVFESVSSDLVRFQQSLRFTGSLRSRRFGPQPELALQNLGGRVFGPEGARR